MTTNNEATPPQKTPLQKLHEAANSLAAAKDADVIIYSGDVYSPADEDFIKLFDKRKRRKNAWLLLTTGGGNPDVGFRIIRALQLYYEKGHLTLCVDQECKSTGTLIALGFDELVISDSGHLGPLDAQVRHRDEIWEQASGLTPGQSLEILRREASKCFSDIFDTLRREMRFPTRIAVEVATKMSTGFFESIYRQIDPVWLGDIERAVKIASEYGAKLIRNGFVDDDKLAKLVGGYPCHSFVIDRKEASEIFRVVRSPDKTEDGVLDSVEPFVEYGRPSDKYRKPLMWIMSDEPSNNDNDGNGTTKVASRADIGIPARTGKTNPATPATSGSGTSNDGQPEATGIIGAA